MNGVALGARIARIGLYVGCTCTGLACAEEATDLEEIVVTGSHIHGAEAAGSKPIVIDRAQIDASGYARIEDVLATVTQNSNRTNAATRDGDEVNNYDNRGAEVQLRGLGLGTTLTLVNGLRQGASGYQGSFVDISSIPASAVERIEILPEGSSALYGSDAIGGVVNIILRNNFEGFEARVRGSTAGGDATERTLAGLWGHAGSDGHVLLGIQYDDSRALACSARAYCAANGDFRRFGGSDRRGVGGNPGTIVDPVTREPIAAIPRSQDGSNLTVSKLITGAANYTNSVTDNDILPQQNMRSAFLSTAYRLSRHWEISVDGRYSSRAFESRFPQPASNPFSVPAGNAFNHLGGPVSVAYDFTADVGPVVDNGRTDTSSISLGIKGALSRGWQLHVSTAYSESSTRFVEYNNLNTAAVDAALDSADPAIALNLFGDGSHSARAVLATLQNQSVPLAYPDKFFTTMASVIADGPLFRGPAGAIRLAAGGDFRREHSLGLNIGLNPENRGRDAAAAFAELAVPLVASRPGSTADRLALSLAGRYDRYSDVGSTFNPKVGVSWRPLRSLGLRGNWGTSFRPPPFGWSSPGLVGDGEVVLVDDPKALSGKSLALELSGPDKDLRPETSTAWSVGADLAPLGAPNLSLAATYFDIDYKGKVRNAGPRVADFLSYEAQLASLITRNPTQAQLDAACKDVRRFYGTGNCSDPITVILDGRFRNLARIKTRGADVSLDYAIDTARGKWAFGLNGTYTISLIQQITPTSPVYDVVNTVGNPLQLRWATHLSWSLKGWNILTTVNYSGAYQDPSTVPARGVDSWTTVDLNLGYRLDGGQGWLANTQCNFGVNNLFDRAPPFVDQFDPQSGTFAYDAANASLLGRQVSLQVVKHLGR
jgi:outer membrane receptor protein involved in Fe transport